MDESHELIIQLIQEQGKRHDAQIKGILKSQESGFDTLAKEMRELKEQKVQQNGRIGKIEKISIVSLGRWVDNNKKSSVFIALISYLGFKTLFTYVSISEIIKRYLPW